MAYKIIDFFFSVYGISVALYLVNKYGQALKMGDVHFFNLSAVLLLLVKFIMTF